MNKNLFRIIFNQHRGQRMAVAETAASQVKTASGQTPAGAAGQTVCAEVPLSMRAVLSLGAISLAVLSAIGVVLLWMPAPAAAQVVAYRQAPGNQQPTILQTANGLPQVNIQTPSAAGVSHNIYSQFDVQSMGIILNNSRTNVQTQQGGWLQANPWLATGSARVILNEVNSSNPSQLNGYVEVAGQRAEVVIANPAGISVNGGGFINTSHATLTTGAPIANGGRLDSYRVQGGNISINGKGLDLGSTDYAAILARAVQVNAGIWAKELKVVMGTNLIDASSLRGNTTPVSTPIAGTGAVPSFALDVAQLGGMYAGQIYLIGTEAGLGVLSAGTLGATGGDLVLQNNGWLTTTGVLQASSNLQISTQGNISNTGTLYASNDQTLIATGTVSNTGILAAQGNTSITAQSLSSNSASVLAAGVKADGTLTNSGSLIVTTTQGLGANGQNLVAGNISLAGSSVDLSGSQTSAANLFIATAGSLNTAQAAVVASQTLNVSSKDFNNTGGTLKAGQAANLQTADLNNDSGYIGSAGTLSVTSLNISNTAGILIADNALTVAASSLGGDGKVLAQGNMNLSLNTNFNNSGQVIANGNATVSTSGNITNSGKLQAGDTLILTASNIDNAAAGEISANTTQLNASSTLNNRGLIDGMYTQIKAATVNNIGTGRIYGDILSLQTNTLLNDAEMVNGITSAATIAARTRLDIGVQNLTNTNNALLYSDGDLAIGGNLDANRRAIGSAQSIINNGSIIEAANHLSLNAQSIQNLNRDLAYRVDTVVGTTVETDYVTDAGSIIKFDETFVLHQATPWGVRYHPDHQSTGYLWRNSGSLYIINPNSTYNSATYRNEYNAADVVNYSIVGGFLVSSKIVNGVNVAAADASRWRLYGLTQPSTALPSAARPVMVCNAYDGAGSCLGYEHASAASQEAWDTAAAPYIALQNKIDALRATMNAEGLRVNNYADYKTDRQVLTVTNSNPGKITSGGSMILNAGTNLLNDMSHIVSGGPINVTGTSLENRQRTQATVDTRAGKNYLWSYKDWGCGSYRGCDWELTAYWDSAYSATINKTSTLSLAQSLQNQAVNSSNSETVRVGMDVVRNIASVTTSAIAGYTTAPNTQLPNNSLYKTNPSTTSAYLLETDSRFTNNKIWLGSEYMLLALNLDPSITQKRLGDGFYEQKLIREQVAELTGRRFLADYTSDDEQYTALMNSAITYAKFYHLRPGIALTAQQLAQLTSDMVWLVEHSVTLADGSIQKVLVPQLYVKTQPGDLDDSGTLLSGKEVNINLSGDLNNNGRIAGRRVVNLAVNNLNNLGAILGDLVDLDAMTDLNNIGGSISATSSLSATAGRDLNVTSTLQQGNSKDGSVGLQRIERVAGLYVSGANGTLVASAGRDFNIVAGVVVNAGSGATALRAVNAVNLQTVTEREHVDVVMEEGKQYSKASQSQEVGSKVSGGGTVSVTANDINARAATLEAGTVQDAEQGTLSFYATNNITIEAGLATQNFSRALKTASHGGLLGSDSETVTKQINNSTTAQASNLGGKEVVLVSRNDIGIKGSNVVSDNATTFIAKNNITIEAEQNTQTQGFEEKKMEKGFLSSGGLSISYGERKQSLDTQDTRITAAASTVGSLNGNLTIQAGEQYKQVGSDVLTPNGDIGIQAKTVNIQEARETNAQSSEQKFEQSGLTLALNSTVVSTVQNAQSQLKAATQTSDSRMKTLAGASAAANMKMAADALQAGQGDEHGMVKTGAESADGSPEVAQANAADKAGGISVSLSYGTSNSQSNSSAQTDTARGSTVKSGGTTTISATGAGENSNLTVQGSDISGQQVSLAADNQVAFLAAQNTSSQTSSNNSNSASVGAAAQLGNGGGGIGITGSLNKGRGSGNGNETTYTNTHVTGLDSVTILSGGDTTFKGATVGGKQVTAIVGGNLNIESLQDTATYAEKNQQVGVSGMVGAGGGGNANFAKSNIDSNYASVTEQSGITAGDGGFQVNVGGRADLKGGAITSTDLAFNQGKNRLTTATITTSDIENQSSVNAQSSGFSVSTNMMNSKYAMAKGAAANLLNNASESASSTGQTKAVVSVGAITITNDEKQQELTGKSARETVASLNTDAANAQKTVTKQDVQAVKETVNAERSIKQEAFKQITAVTTDLVNQQQTADKKILFQKCDADGQNCGKAIQVDASDVKVINGKAYVFNNGIMNNEKDALANAAKQSSPEANQQGVYVIINPHTGNPVAEVLTAAWDKLSEITNAGLPISNAASANIDVRDQVKAQGGVVVEVDHSRGALTGSVAISEQVNRGVTDAAVGAVTFNGGAANAQRMADQVNTATSGTGVVQQATHKDDTIGRFVGGNAATGGRDASMSDAHTTYTGSLPPLNLSNGDKNDLRFKTDQVWGHGQTRNPISVSPSK